MEENKFDWIDFYDNLLKIICNLSNDNNIAAKKLYDIYVKIPDTNIYDFNDFEKVDPLTYIALISKNLPKYHQYLEQVFGIKNFPNNNNGIPSYENRKHDYVYSKEIFLDKSLTQDNPDQVFNNLWDFARAINAGEPIENFIEKIISYADNNISKLSKILFICKPKIYYSLDEKMRNYVDKHNHATYTDFENFQCFCKNKYTDKEPYEISYEAHLEAIENDKKAQKENPYKYCINKMKIIDFTAIAMSYEKDRSYTSYDIINTDFFREIKTIRPQKFQPTSCLKKNPNYFEVQGDNKYKLTDAGYNFALKQKNKLTSAKKKFEDNYTQKGNSNMIPEQKKIQSLNQILYGPPGTGKTYNSINYAVAAVENKNIEDVKNEPYSNVKQRYDSYKLNKQIEFVTFHQSYSYEEFVEGIKPYIPNGEKDNSIQILKYERKDGVFKNICDKAKNIRKESNKQNYNFENMSFYKLWLSDPGVYEYCKENNCISLGWAGEFDFTDCIDTNMIKEKFPDNYQQKSAACSQLDIFKIWIDNDLKQGKDVIVIIPETWTTIRAIGRIIGNYKYSQETENISHLRKVEWLKTDVSIPYNSVYSSKFMPPALSGMFKEKFNKENFINFINNKDTIESENCVLIIDEINRGNISKIFGELITLIEDDKRGSISVTLPYSQESFTVPKNLYIIGTMNTADRSIASVDIALRRRFRFVEMMPKPELLRKSEDTNNDVLSYWGVKSEQEDYKINLQQLLITLNERISYLLDPDRQIGHSYFLNLIKDDNGNKKDYILESDLKDVFKYEILPLLNEYFYGDWDKLQSVFIDNNKDEVNKKYKININNSFIKEEKALLLRCDYNTNSKRYSFRIDDNDFNIRSAIESIGENIISPDEIRNVKNKETVPKE